MSQFTLITLPLSPHNTKVRLALKLKGLSYEAVEVGFEDRSQVLAKSGQPLTPVLLDGDRAIYDSFGIIRYLDANWPEPKLFSEDRQAQQEIQQWERFAVAEVGATLGQLVGSFLSGTDEPETNARVQAGYDDFTARVEEALADSPYLGGETPNAADLTLAPFFRFAATSPTDFPEGSPGRFVSERCQLIDDYALTRAWALRVMEIDAVEPGQKAAVASA